MNTFLITDDGQLVEVIEHHTVIRYIDHCGPTAQPRTNVEFKIRGKATEEDRRRIPQAMGGDA